MGFFQVTASELRRKAETMQSLNRQFGVKSSELEEKEAALCTMWEGQAKEAFHGAFQKDRQQMEAFERLIDRYVQTLLEIATRYEEAEARNAELASSRNY